MKDYNEMAKAVFARRDEYLAEKKRKRAMLLKAGVPVCSLLLVSLVGISIWMAKLPEIPTSTPVDKPTSSRTETEPDTSRDDNAVLMPEVTDDVTAKPSQGNVNKPIAKPTEPDSGDAPQTGGTKPQVNVPPTSAKPKPTESVNDTVPGVVTTPTEGVEPEAPVPPPTTQTATCSPTDAFPLPQDTIPPILQPTVPPTTVAPTQPPTGPVKIKVADKTYTAQTGDKVTYTIEMQAEEKFEDIQMRIKFDGDYLQFVAPSNIREDASAIAPNLKDVIGGYSYRHVGVNAVNLSKFDFRNRKVLVQVEFIVKRGGYTTIDFEMQEMTIECIDWVYKSYFTGSQQKIFDGIKFYHKVSVS